MKAPKSKNSYRTIALSTVVLDALAGHMAAFGAGEDGLVFHIDTRDDTLGVSAEDWLRTAAV